MACWTPHPCALHAVFNSGNVSQFPHIVYRAGWRVGWESAMPHQYNTGDVVTVLISPSNWSLKVRRQSATKRTSQPRRSMSAKADIDQYLGASAAAGSAACRIYRPYFSWCSLRTCTHRAPERLGALEPPISETDLAIERFALEVAIQRVETGSRFSDSRHDLSFISTTKQFVRSVWSKNATA